jgi:hypothetical protein
MNAAHSTLYTLHIPQCNAPVDESPKGSGEEEYVGVDLELWYLGRHPHLRARK